MSGPQAADAPARPVPALRGVLSLGLANGLAILCAAVAATLYAAWLDPDEFAHWALALALARATLLLLDGGLKTALVRCSQEPDAATLRRLTRASACVAALLTLVIAGVVAALASSGRLATGQAVLLVACPAAYLLTYPPMFGALARLERAGRFSVVGRAEGVSVLIEFVLPAALLAGGGSAAASFAGAAWLSRLLRSAWISQAARALPAAEAPAAAGPLGALLRDGLALQAVAGLSMLRDQMPLWLLAAGFGSTWVGLFGFAMTACALVSQAAVQTAARVALPVLRRRADAARWPMVLKQTRALAIVTLPPLALLPAWLAQADALVWDGRWQAALALVPWLAARMIPGVATTTLGAWLLVVRPPWVAARAHAAWTLGEGALAMVCLAWLGPLGLAVAAAAGAWGGLLLFLAAAAPGPALGPALRALCATLLFRPSLLAALALALGLRHDPSLLVPATLALPLAWACEAPVRRWLHAALRGRRQPAALTAHPARSA